MRTCAGEEVRNLCKLADLKGMTVDGLMAKAGISPYAVPLDMDKLLKAWRIIASSTDMSDFEEIANKHGFENGEIWGAVGASRGNVILMFSDKISFPRARFTVAHELAHCCLHNDDLKDGYIYFRQGGVFQPTFEEDANRFARELLMPEESLRVVIDDISNENPGITNDRLVDKLAMRYEVEAEEVEHRLKALNYLKREGNDEEGDDADDGS